MAIFLEAFISFVALYRFVWVVFFKAPDEHGYSLAKFIVSFV